MRIITGLYDNPESKKPHKLMVEKLKKSALDLGYDFTMYDLSKEEVGILGNNTYFTLASTRPQIIRKALDEFSDDIVWCDGDCVIVKPIDEVLNDCDVAFTLRKIEDREMWITYGELLENPLLIYLKQKCFGYFNGGVEFFRNNENSRRFIDLWEEELKTIPNEQGAASSLLLKYSPLEKYNEIVDVEGIKVKILPYIYNFFYFNDDDSEAKVLHYKGELYKLCQI